MKALSLPPAPRPDVDDKQWRTWVLACFQEIERASQVSSERMMDDFAYSGTITESRTLPAATGSLAEVRNVLGTFIKDVKRRGKKGRGD